MAKKTPERQLQSQIDKAKAEYLWACANFRWQYKFGYDRADSSWFARRDEDARRWRIVWATLREVKRGL